MRRRILGALIAVGALSSVAEPTTNLENDRSFLVQMDPMTMSHVQLAGAFPHEFEYLQLTYGLDNDGAAEALRLTWTAGNTRAWAMTSLPGFAGAWVDYTQSRVFVGVADGVVVSQRSHRALAAAAGPRGARPTLVAMPRSYDDLVDDAARIHDMIDPTGDEMIEVEIDERRGALNVAGLSHAEATADAAVGHLLATEGFPQVNWRAADITDPADVTGGWDAQQGAGCTMAFTVVSPSNARAVLTAGHCADNPVKTGQVTLSDRTAAAIVLAVVGWQRGLGLRPATAHGSPRHDDRRTAAGAERAHLRVVPAGGGQRHLPLRRCVGGAGDRRPRSARWSPRTATTVSSAWAPDASTATAVGPRG